MANSNDMNNSISYEVDRQIKEILARRKSLHADITSVKRAIFKHSFFWMRNNVEHVNAKNVLSDRLRVLEEMYNASIYTFREPVTREFISLKSQFDFLKSSYTKIYDNTPSIRQIMVAYNPIGDMKNIRFSTEPLCFALGNNIFCVIPYYIVQFRSNGDYVTTYSSKAIRGGLANGSYNERIRHVTWAHTRVDGSPDRRYKNNPQRVYYTTTTHTVYNLLVIGIVNYQLNYEVDESIKHNMLSAIKQYSALVPTKVYDPSYHLLRLLKLCEEDNSNITRLEKITGTSISAKNMPSQNQLQKLPSKFKVAVFVFFATVCSGWSLYALFMFIIFLAISDYGFSVMALSLSGLGALGTYIFIMHAIENIRMRVDKQYKPKNITSRIIISSTLAGVLWFVFISGIGMSFGNDDTDNVAVTESVSESVQQTAPTTTTTAATTITEDESFDEIWAISPTPLEYFEYEISDDTIYLEKYIGDDKRVWIDSEYTIEGETYVVGSEVGRLFALGDVYSVILPEGITQVPNSIFNSCGVKYIYIPETLEPDDGYSWYDYLHDVVKVFYGGDEDEWTELTNYEDRSSIDIVQIVYDVSIDDLFEYYNQTPIFSSPYSECPCRPTDICYFDFYIDDDMIYLKKYIGENDFVWIDTEYTIDGVTYEVADTLYDLTGLSDASTIIISEGFTVIDEYMFSACNELQTLYLPNTLDPEECGAFYLNLHKDVATIAYGGSEDEWNILVNDTDRASINATEIKYDMDYETVKQNLLDIT